MDREGSKKVEITGMNDKHYFFCASLAGDFLPIYKARQSNFNFPPDCIVTHSSKHSSTEEMMIQYIDNVIIPYVEVQREYEGDTNLQTRLH